MPPSKDYIKISYPRECLECGYSANNPAMYHYHKKTHSSVPDNQLCDHGCGQKAIAINTGGKYQCTEKYSQCPEYVKEHSKRIAEQWQRPGNEIRREQAKSQILKIWSTWKVSRPILCPFSLAQVWANPRQILA
jgi:hypothetical protein